MASIMSLTQKETVSTNPNMKQLLRSEGRKGSYKLCQNDGLTQKGSPRMRKIIGEQNLHCIQKENFTDREAKDLLIWKKINKRRSRRKWQQQHSNEN